MTDRRVTDRVQGPTNGLRGRGAPAHDAPGRRPALTLPDDWPSHDRPNLHAAAEWLARSIDVTGTAGSSVAFRLYRGWHWPYPETTGYIIPTFYDYAEACARPEFADRATRAADWLVSLQYDDGAFPASHVDGKPKPPSVFNTGQIIQGLVAAHERVADPRYLDSAARAAAWLAGQQDDDGQWRRHSYRGGGSPSYYARVCWPMLQCARHTGDGGVQRAAIRGLRAIVERRRGNDTIADWGFAPGRPAFTHTIAYTIRGLLESAEILAEGGEEAGGVTEACHAAAAAACMKLFRLLEVNKRLAAAYDDSWRGTHWYVCLTGHCQIALCWMRLGDRTGDLRLLNAACKAIDVVTASQRLGRWVPRAIRGGVAGSRPVFGRYVALRYPNWAAKFLMDAILYRNERLRWLRLNPPNAGFAFPSRRLSPA